MERFEERVNDCQEVITGFKRRYSYLGLDAQDDIVQECHMAVFKAMKLYDPSQGSFRSYATNWIKTYVYDYINKVQSPVAISRETNRKIRAIKEAIMEHPGASLAEIAELTGLSLNQVVQYYRGIKGVSLDTPIDEDEELVLLDTIADSSGEEKIKAEAIKTLFEHIEGILAKEDLELLYSFFGINTKKLTQKELALRYHVTHQAISKRINSIIKRLQSAMATDCSLFDAYSTPYIS